MSSRRVTIAGIGGGLVLLILWYVVLWSPRQSDIRKARQRATAAEQNANDLRLQLAHLQDLRKSEVSKRAQIETFRLAVPDQPNLAQFILDTNDAATKAGIDFLSVSPQQPSAPTGGAASGTTSAALAKPTEVRVSVTITGGYYQILNFVNLVDDLPRIVVIDTITVTPSQGGQLSVALQARIFVSGPIAAPGVPTTTTAPPATTTTVPRITVPTTAPLGSTTASGL